MSGGLNWLFWLLGGVVALAGAALGWWALFADRARGRPRCPKCWYDLGGSNSLSCSECGYVARRDSKLLKTRRRWRWALAAALLMAVGYEISVTPRIQRHWQWYGWRGTIPTTALLVALPWLEPEGALAGDLGMRLHQAWEWQRAWYARFWESRYRSAEGQARGAALEAIGLVGGAAAEGSLPTVFGAARDDDPVVRSRAVYALGMILRDSETSIPLLVELLGDENVEVRQNAAWALWKFGHEAYDAVPALRAALSDESEDVRTQSAVALSVIADDPRIALPVLTDALRSVNQLPPIQAVLALGQLDPEVEGVMPALIEALRHPDVRVRRLTVTFLADFGPRAAPAVPALIERLDEHGNYIDAWAAHALGKIGLAAEPAVPALRELARIPDEHTRRAAEEALERIRDAVARQDP